MQSSSSPSNLDSIRSLRAQAQEGQMRKLKQIAMEFAIKIIKRLSELIIDARTIGMTHFPFSLWQLCESIKFHPQIEIFEILIKILGEFLETDHLKLEFIQPKEIKDWRVDISTSFKHDCNRGNQCAAGALDHQLQMAINTYRKTCGSTIVSACDALNRTLEQQVVQWPFAEDYRIAFQHVCKLDTGTEPYKNAIQLSIVDEFRKREYQIRLEDELFIISLSERNEEQEVLEKTRARSKEEFDAAINDMIRKGNAYARARAEEQTNTKVRKILNRARLKAEERQEQSRVEIKKTRERLEAERIEFKRNCDRIEVEIIEQRARLKEETEKVEKGKKEIKAEYSALAATRLKTESKLQEMSEKKAKLKEELRALHDKIEKAHEEVSESNGYKGNAVKMIFASRNIEEIIKQLGELCESITDGVDALELTGPTFNKEQRAAVGTIKTSIGNIRLSLTGLKSS
jgi:hypothetical protein